MTGLEIYLWLSGMIVYASHLAKQPEVEASLPAKALAVLLWPAAIWIDLFYGLLRKSGG